MATQLEKRLILKQDIDFDTDGSGATTEVSLPGGGTADGDKLNAGHIPLTQAVRDILTSATSVEDAIEEVVEMIGDAGGNASTTAKGIIEIATLTEAKAGTDQIRALTPYLLKNVKATESQQGTVTLASESEAENGTDNEKAITALALKAALDYNLAQTLEYGMEIDYVDATTISISAGRRIDSTHTQVISATSDMTKDIVANWTSGSGNGGRATGAALAAGKTFYAFELYNPTTKKSDMGFDDVLTAANLLSDASGFTYFIYRGSFRLQAASTDIIPFERTGNIFEYLDWIDLGLANDYSSAKADIDLPIPTGLKMVGLVQINGEAGTEKAGSLTSPWVNDMTIAKDAICSFTTSSMPLIDAVPTNTSGQVSIKTTGSFSPLVGYCRGYQDISL